MTLSQLISIIGKDMSLLLFFLFIFGFLVIQSLIYTNRKYEKKFESYLRKSDYDKDRETDRKLRDLTIDPLKKEFKDFEKRYQEDFNKLEAKVDKIYDVIMSSSG